MHVLWAPWRMAYVAAQKERTCIFCAARDTDDQRAALVLARRPALIMLNKFPYANGHLMVAPRRHAAHLDALSPDEFATLMRAVHRTATLLDTALRPDGMNLGINLGAAAGAGVKDHLHWHIVPRWLGDTNFMPMLADVRVIPEHLDATYSRLEPLFRTLATG
ncbi:MAG: HIT family protein [Candidatus Binatia bacterium]